MWLEDHEEEDDSEEIPSSLDPTGEDEIVPPITHEEFENLIEEILNDNDHGNESDE